MKAATRTAQQTPNPLQFAIRVPDVDAWHSWIKHPKR
jgi:hypothetical protein